MTLAIVGTLTGCSSSSTTPTITPTPTPLPAVTEHDVDQAVSRLVAQEVTASELAAACSYYVANGWAYPDAWDAAIDDRMAATDLLQDMTYGDYSEALASYLMGTPVPTDRLTKPDRESFEVERAIIIERFTRLEEVITDVSIVVEDIVFPDGWAVSVLEGMGYFDKAEWTEADQARYEGVIVARKRQLMEPLCASSTAYPS